MLYFLFHPSFVNGIYVVYTLGLDSIHPLQACGGGEGSWGEGGCWGSASGPYILQRQRGGGGGKGGKGAARFAAKKSQSSPSSQ